MFRTLLDSLKFEGPSRHQRCRNGLSMMKRYTWSTRVSGSEFRVKYRSL